jgi:hypothetical protein
LNQIRVESLLFIVIALGVIAMPMRAQAQWWSSREPVDYEDCAERAEKNADAKPQREKLIAACESQFAGRRKPGGGYSYYDFMQDRHFDIAGPNPTLQEQREIDQHYTAFLDQNRRSIIAAAFARKQRELTEAKLTADAPSIAKPSAKAQIAKSQPKPAPNAPLAAPVAEQPRTPPRVVVASLTPPRAPIPARVAMPSTPRPSAAVLGATPPAAGVRPSTKPKRGACREQSLSCGLSQLGDGVSSLTRTIFGPPPKKAGRS